MWHKLFEIDDIMDRLDKNGQMCYVFLGTFSATAILFYILS